MSEFYSIMWDKCRNVYNFTIHQYIGFVIIPIFTFEQNQLTQLS
jgi:hypothetical protein